MVLPSLETTFGADADIGRALGAQGILSAVAFGEIAGRVEDRLSMACWPSLSTMRMVWPALNDAGPTAASAGMKCDWTGGGLGAHLQASARALFSKPRTASAVAVRQRSSAGDLGAIAVISTGFGA